MKGKFRKLKVKTCRGLSLVMLLSSVSVNPQVMAEETIQGGLPLQAVSPPVLDSATSMAATDTATSDSSAGAEGTAGNTVSYSEGVTGGSITFDKATGTVIGCDSTVTSAVIPEEIEGIKVTAIGDSAFAGSGITEISIPDSVASVGSSAFSNCTSLVKVNIGKGVTAIPEKCFYNCHYLKEVTNAENITLVDNQAFYDCYNLESINLPAVETIADYSFAYTSALNDIGTNPNLKTIGEKAFYSSGITSISLSDKVSYIGGYAFSGCSKLKIYCPADSYAHLYAKANNLNYELPDNEIIYGAAGGNIYIDRYSGVITKCDTSVTSVVIPERVEGVEITGIGKHAFDSCTMLSALILPDTIRSIQEYGISNCDGIKVLRLPDSLTVMEGHAIDGCDGIKTLEIPGSVTSMESYAVSECKALEEMTVGGNFAVASDAIYSCTALKRIVFKEGITSISSWAVSNCALQSVVIPKSVEMMPYNAITYSYSGGSRDKLIVECCYGTAGEKYAKDNGIRYRLTDDCLIIPADNGSGNVYVSRTSGTITSSDETITSVSIPASVDDVSITSVGNAAFRYCTKLKEVYFAEGVNRFEAGCFNNCSSLKKISVMDKDAVIPRYFLDGIGSTADIFCKSGSTMEEFCKSNNRKYICVDGYYELEAEGGTIKLDLARGTVAGFSGSPTSVKIPQEVNGVTITGVDNRAFYQCSSLKSIVLPDTVTKIGEYAFYNAGSLTDINMPEGLNEIGQYAFYYCRNMSVLSLPDKLENIGRYAFYYCSAIKISEIPDSVTYMGDYAFSYSGIQSLYIGKGLTTIPSYAFSNCSSLKSVKLTNTVSIGYDAFYYCYNLESVECSDNLETIGEQAFCYCYRLQSANLTPALKSIGNYAFYNCSAFNISEIPDSVTSIGENTFGYSGIESINIGSGLKSIVGFANCKKLKSVSAPYTNKIEANAFSGCSSLTSLNLSGDVEELGKSAFANCTMLESINLEGLTRIPSYAFDGCTSLRTVVLSKELIDIDSYAFRNCKGLELAALPEKTRYIESYAFSGCSGVKFSVIPDSVISVGSYALYNTGIENIKIGNGITYLSSYVLANCKALESVTFSPSLTNISDHAFYNDSLIKTITLGEKTESIGNNAFGNCTGLAEVYIYGKSTSIYDNAFSNCADGLKIYGHQDSVAKTYADNNSITFVDLNGAELYTAAIAVKGGNIYVDKATGEIIRADSTVQELDLTTSTGGIEIKSIGASAFAGNSNLRIVKLGSSIKNISYSAFSGCSALEEVDLGSVETIGSDAFYYCSSLERVTGTESVKKMDSYAFYGCSSLKSISFSKLDRIEYNSFYDCSSLESVTLPDTLKYIGSNAFYNCSMLKEIYLGSVETIDGYAFYNCSSLESITMPDSLKVINYYAFDHCSKLKSVSLSSAEYIGSYAFSNCGMLESIIIPDNVKTISYGAFENCKGLKSVSLGSVEYIESNAFRNCDMLESIIIPDGVKTISYAAFENCKGLKSVSLGSVETIGSYAFSSCISLESIEIPNTVKNISSEAFVNCSKLKSVSLGSVEYISDRAFYMCSSLESVVIPDTAKTIGSYTFSECDMLKTVSLGSVTSIGYRAFSYSDLLESITIPDTVTYLSDYAFSDCLSLKKIEVPDSVTRIGRGCFGMPGDMVIYCNSGSTAEQYAKDNTLEYVINGGMIEYALTGGKIYIDPQTGIISSADNTITAADIPSEVEGVTIVSVGCAFTNNTNLKEVTLPETINFISDNAFYRCTSLSSITAKGEIKSIGERAFCGCKSLENCAFLENAEIIGSYAFNSCGLTDLKLGSGVRSIGDYAFSGNNISEILIPKTVTSIGECIHTYGKSPMYYVYSDSEGFRYVTRNGYSYKLVNDVTIVSDGKGSVEPEGVVPVVYGESLTIKLSPSDSNATATAVVSGNSGKNVYTSGITDSITIDNIKESKSVEILFTDGITQATDIELEESEIKLEYGSKGRKINYMVYPETATIDDVIFTSRDSKIATVTVDGFITPRSIGETTIICTSGDGAITKTINVVVQDTTKPVFYSEPEATIVAGTTVGFKWGVAGDASGIEKYVVLRDGQPIAETTALSYIDTNLTIDTAYIYEIMAVDLSGNMSDKKQLTITTAIPSGSVQPYPVDGTAMGGAKPTRIGVITSKLASEQTLMLSVQYSADGSSWASVPPSDILGVVSATSTETELAANFNTSSFASGAYTVRFIVTSSDGTSAEATAVYIVDNDAPAAPKTVSGIAGELMNTLTWSEGINADTAGYYVYRSVSPDSGFEKIAKCEGRGNNYYADKSLEAGKTYYYYVTSYDNFAQEGEASEIAALTVLEDTQAPQILGLVVNGKNNQGFTVSGEISAQVKAVDNYKVKRIELVYSLDGGKTYASLISKDTQLLDEVTETFTVDTKKFDSDNVIFKIICEDYYGNVTNGEDTYSYRIDNTPPEQVTGLRAEVNSTIVTLNWNDVTADDFSYFAVEEKSDYGFKLIQKISNARGCNIKKAVPEKTYTYRVCAYDMYGNKGEYSKEITVTTQQDTFCPVVKDISPKQSAHNDKISVTVSVEDDHAVDYVEIQISPDAQSWKVYTVEDVTVSSSACKVNTDIDLSGIEDGSLYVKAVPVDYAGNRGDEENTTYVQYIVDHTPPAAPVGVMAKQENGQIKVEWGNPGGDVVAFDVYRAEREDGAYIRLRNKTNAITIYDNTCIREKTYYYYVLAYDAAGNVSEKSAVVSAALGKDTEAPVVADVYPINGSTIGKTELISVFFTDNDCISEAAVQYLDNNMQWQDAQRDKVDTATHYVRFAVKDEMVSSQAVTFRAYAVDCNGNTSDYIQFGYDVNSVCPVINEFTCTPDVESIQISAQYETADVASVCLYRAEEKDTLGEYRCLGYFPVNSNGIADYTDTNVSSAKTYSYKLVITNKIGNVSQMIVSDVKPYRLTEENDNVKPVAVITAPSTVIAGAENYFDASESTDNLAIASYKWDFGDGSTSIAVKPVHTFTKDGEYTVRLTVADTAGNTDTAEAVVKVKAEDKVGSVTVKIVDNYGAAVENIGVYVNLGSDNMKTYYTDKDGKFKLVDEEGVYTIGVYANGYLPAKQVVSVIGKVDKEVIINVKNEPMVVGELTHHKMSLEEIEAVGIDITKNENKYVYEYTVTFMIEEEIYDYKYYANRKEIINDKGFIILGYGGARYKAEARHMGTDKSGKPRTVVTLIKIPGGISWVKDFFEVELTVVNQADSEFYIKDSTVKLNVPDGLTIVEANGYCNGTNEIFGDFHGGESHVTKWVVRGDKDGSYDISADFDGILADFNEPVHFEFKADEPIVVDGASNLKMTVIAEEIVGGEFDYAMKVGITNLSGEPVSMQGASSNVLGYGSVEKYKETTTGRLTEENLNQIGSGETLWEHFIIPASDYEKIFEKGNFRKTNKVSQSSNRPSHKVTQSIETGAGSNVEIPSTLDTIKRFSFCRDHIDVFYYDGINVGEKFDTYVSENHSIDNDYSITHPGYAVRVRRELYNGKLVPISTKVRIKSSDGGYKNYVSDKNGFVYVDSVKVDYDAQDWQVDGSNNTVDDLATNYSIKTGRGYTDICVIGKDERNGVGKLTGTVYGLKDGKYIAAAGFTVSTMNVSTVTDENGKFTLVTPMKGAAELRIRGKYDNTKYWRNVAVTIKEDSNEQITIGFKSDGEFTNFGKTLMSFTSAELGGKYYERLVLPGDKIQDVVNFDVPVNVVETEKRYTVKSVKAYITHNDGGTTNIATVKDGITGKDIRYIPEGTTLRFTLATSQIKPGDKVSYEMILTSDDNTEVLVWGEPDFCVAPLLGELYTTVGFSVNSDGDIKVGNNELGFDMDGYKKFMGKDSVNLSDNAPSSDNAAGMAADAVTKQSALKLKGDVTLGKAYSGEYKLNGEFVFAIEQEAAVDLLEYKLVDSLEVAGDLKQEIHYAYNEETGEWDIYHDTGVTGKAGVGILLPPIPVYPPVELELTFDVEGEVGLNWETGNTARYPAAVIKEEFVPNDFHGKIGLKATAIAQVGAGLLGVGAYAGGSAGVDVKDMRYSERYNRVTMGLNFGFVEKFLWMKFSQECFNNEWVVYDSRGNEYKDIESFAVEDDSIKAFSEDIAPAQTERSWDGYIGNAEKSTVMTGAYSNNHLSVVELDDGSQLMTFVDYAEGDNANPLRLNYSVNRNGSWSTPKAVCDDGTVDMTPVLEKTTNGARVMWVNMNNVLGENEEMLSRKDIENNYLDKLGVYYADFDAQSGIWSNQNKVSSDGKFSYSPVYATDGTTGMSAYVTSVGLEGTQENPSKLNFVYTMGDEVVSSGAIVTDSFNITDVNIGCDENGYCLVFRDDTTSLIYTSRYSGNGWSYPKRISSNSCAEEFASLVKAEDKLLLYYVKDNSIYCKNLTDNTSESVIINSDMTKNIGGLSVFVDKQGKVVTLGWYACVNGVYQIAVSRFDAENTCFGNGIAVTQLDTRTVPTGIEIVVDADGINIYYTTMSLLDNNMEDTRIEHIFLPMYSDLTPDSVECVSVVEGAESELMVGISNVGLAASDSYTISIADNINGNNPVASTQDDTLIVSGGSNKTYLTFTMPKSEDNSIPELYVIVTDTDDKNAENNYIKVDMDRTNLEINDKALYEYLETTAVVNVRNNSIYNAEPFKVVARSAKTQEIICEKLVSGISSAESRDVELVLGDLPAECYDENDKAVIKLTVESADESSDKEYDSDMLLVNKPLDGATSLARKTYALIEAIGEVDADDAQKLREIDSNIKVMTDEEIAYLTNIQKFYDAKAAYEALYGALTILYGDVNNDKVVLASDAAMALQYVLDNDSIALDEEGIRRTDVDASGQISSNDAAFILQKALNSAFILPVETIA